MDGPFVSTHFDSNKYLLGMGLIVPSAISLSTNILKAAVQNCVSFVMRWLMYSLERLVCFHVTCMSCVAKMSLALRMCSLRGGSPRWDWMSSRSFLQNCQICSRVVSFTGYTCLMEYSEDPIMSNSDTTCCKIGRVSIVSQIFGLLCSGGRGEMNEEYRVKAGFEKIHSLFFPKPALTLYSSGCCVQ